MAELVRAHGRWLAAVFAGLTALRFGLSPTINAIGVPFILLTVATATVWVLLRRRQA